MENTATAATPAVQQPRALSGVVVCALAMAATAWAVLAGGWADNGGGAIVVAVAAAVEGALLARAAVSRLVTIAVAPFLALAAIVPTTIGAMPFDGNGSAGHVAARYLSALFTGLSSSENWTFVVGLCAVLWLCGYWLPWAALGERRPVLAVLPLYVVLATNVLNTKAPANVGTAEALAVLCTLLVLAGAHLESLQARWERGMVQPLPGTRTRFAASVAVVAVALTVAAMLIPGATSTDVSGKLFPGATQGNGAGPQSGGGATVQFSASTEPGGPLTTEKRQLLTYTTSTNVPVYLSVVTDTYFSDGNWFPSEPGASTQVGEEVVPYSGGSLPRDRSVSDGGIGSDETAVTATVQLTANATGNIPYVPFPGEPDWSDAPGHAVGTVQFSANGTPSSLLTVDGVQAAAGFTGNHDIVHSRGLVSTATVTQLEAAGSAYPLWTQQYTALDDDSNNDRETVTKLAQQWTAGTANAYDAAVAIESHLRDPRYFTYTLRPPEPPVDEWAIVYFLQTTHEGYCQYFADTMGTMLRALGIPARLVSGFGPGTTQGERDRNGNLQQLVTSDDAHVWVQAYFPGYGWIPFEPTPPSSDGNYTQFPRGNAAVTPPAPTAAPTTPNPTAKPGFTGGGPAPVGTATQRTASHTGLVVLAVIGGVLIVVVALFIWLLLPRSLRGTWRRLEVLGVMLGMRRTASETHLEYAARFGASSSRHVNDTVLRIAHIIGRAEFGTTDGDTATLHRVHGLWRGALWRALPQLLQRRRANRRTELSPA